MARRLPGIRGRMELAAIELFTEQGFASTTAAQIAARAGTTERTFFRHFREKADAAFGGELAIQREFVTGARGADPSASPWSATCIGFSAAAALIAQNPPAFRARTAVVAANAELQDRELARGAAWTDVISALLMERGADEVEATICAGTGLALFRIGLLRWAAALDRPLQSFLDEVWITTARLLTSAGPYRG